MLVYGTSKSPDFCSFCFDRKQVFCFISHRFFWIPLELCLGFRFLGKGHTVSRKFVVSVLCTSKNIKALFFLFFDIHFLRGAGRT